MFYDYQFKSVISIMLIMHFSSMQQQIMYNMEVTGSLVDHQIGGVSCINWCNY